MHTAQHLQFYAVHEARQLSVRCSCCRCAQASENKYNTTVNIEGDYLVLFFVSADLSLAASEVESSIQDHATGFLWCPRALVGVRIRDGAQI